MVIHFNLNCFLVTLQFFNKHVILFDLTVFFFQQDGPSIILHKDCNRWRILCICVYQKLKHSSDIHIENPHTMTYTTSSLCTPM